MDSYARVRGRALKLKRKKDGADVKASQKVKTDWEKIEKPLEGRVVSNGTTIQGLETHFQRDLSVGHKIGIVHPSTGQIETRSVESIISERTLIIDEPFSSDVITTCNYFIAANEPLMEDKEVMIREKRGMWRYEMVKSKTDGDQSATDLLDQRIKKVGRDKFC